MIMESDTNSDAVSLAREKALHLAAEVAETDDNNVPVLLLGLKDILDSCPENSEIGAIIRKDLWSYDIIHVSNLALKQDFKAIRGQWGTAASLSVLLCRCCVGLQVTDDPQYESHLLPDIVETIISISSKLLDNYTTASLDEDKKYLFDGFKDTISGLEMLYKHYQLLSLKVLQSKRFLHLLMAEDLAIAQFFMSVVESMWKSCRQALSELSQDTLHSILDEIVFKISASEETLIGRGLKAYLSKWKNRGFDGDVRRLVALLESRNAEVAAEMKLYRSAALIQAYYRGFRTRKQLKQADRGITLLQRKFRQKQLERDRKREEKTEQEERSLAFELKKLAGFRSSMRKKLHMLETVPAREVNKFMVEHQDQAASRIQAAFRGMKTRQEMQTVKKDYQRTKAATAIQRQYRRYRKIKEESIPYPMPPGLTDERRVELQNIIVDHRERFPTKHRSADELKELHEKAHSLLAKHLTMRIKTRKNEQKRDALLARLKMDTDLLLASSRLQDANPDKCNMFQSRSAPVITKAQSAHNEELQRQKLSWWMKMQCEQSKHGKVSSEESSNIEELNF